MSIMLMGCFEQAASPNRRARQTVPKTYRLGALRVFTALRLVYLGKASTLPVMIRVAEITKALDNEVRKQVYSAKRQHRYKALSYLLLVHAYFLCSWGRG